METRDFVPDLTREIKKFGANVVIRNFWQRHAQKMSGEVLNVEKTALSRSSLSPKGFATSKELGGTISARKHGVKGYVSSIDRTTETLNAILEGYRQKNPDAPIRAKLRIVDALNPGTHLAWGQKFDKIKDQILADRGLKPEDFSKLSADEQETIAEEAEEPVIREWLDEPDSELAKVIPPRPAAASFAYLFDRHHKIAQRLSSGSEVDLFHVTHKSVTEAFLTSGVLVRKGDNQRITKLSDIGGSLKILDNWESEIRTDENGQGKVTVRIRGEEFDVDPNVLSQLLTEAKEQKHG